MRKEFKDVIELLLIVLPACAFIFVLWLNSPMYEETIQAQRENVIVYLNQTYYTPDGRADRDRMIEYYEITDAEINPSKIFQALLNGQGELDNLETVKSTLTLEGYFRNLLREVRGEDTN